MEAPAEGGQHSINTASVSLRREENRHHLSIIIYSGQEVLQGLPVHVAAPVSPRLSLRLVLLHVQLELERLVLQDGDRLRRVTVRQ